ncbi:hypothetical protein G9C98_007199 [Cotesia typhae]|uniref:LIM zinc-binding domain-containing protein n=1 Tax=Cotesia typhae TaxID=2053667 RepID=A0A8J5UYH1_9HYME|nr:hypothetical protein G9C98_007199 [Cotesia typhae]
MISDLSPGPGVMECGGCGERVRERTVLCVGGRTWHSRCLRCCVCARPLHDQHSCFLRGMRLYCRHDYAFRCLITGHQRLTPIEARSRSKATAKSGIKYQAEEEEEQTTGDRGQRNLMVCWRQNHLLAT